MWGYVKFILFGSACSQYAAIVEGSALINKKIQDVLTGEQIVTHNMKPARRVKGRKRRGEGGGGGGGERERNRLKEEADYVRKGKMLCL